MSMGVGGKKGGPQSDINMTPMIDVLLVLLIIFMVVQQGLQRGISVQIPPPKEKDEVAQKEADDLRMVVVAGPRFRPNQAAIMAISLGALIPRRTLSPRMSTTVTSMSSPIMIVSSRLDTYTRLSQESGSGGSI